MVVSLKKLSKHSSVGGRKLSSIPWMVVVGVVVKYFIASKDLTRRFIMYKLLLVISLIVLPHSVRQMLPVLSVTTKWSNIGIVSAVFVVTSLMCSTDIVTTPCIDVVFSAREGILPIKLTVLASWI